jgi:transposase-like protein
MSIKTVDQIKSTRANPQFNFSQKQILSIVAEVSNGLSRKEACIKYGMAYGTVGDWMKRYGPGAKKAQVPNHKKREVVRAVTEGRMTVKEAQLACNVLSTKSIREWIKQMHRQSADIAGINNPSMPNVITVDPQKELAEAKLKIAALETMIDIAEEQFKISIRKKPGAKQLQK